MRAGTYIKRNCPWLRQTEVWICFVCTISHENVNRKTTTGRAGQQVKSPVSPSWVSPDLREGRATPK